MDKARINELTVEAKKLVAKIVAQTPHVVAAYSDGSFAREDMVRGSDVDIAFIVAGDPGGFKVRREIIGGAVFEWAFIGREAYGDVESILGNAGFVHDLV
jgi:predicted nucleotidyltransferase